MADFTLLTGNCIDVLKTLPAESVHCVVTSPPYWGLRDYGTAEWEGGDSQCEHVERTGGHLKDSVYNTRGGANKVTDSQTLTYRRQCARCGARRIDSQLGLEATPEEYVANLVTVFREVRRVLRSDGTAWVNLGDSLWNSTFIRERSSDGWADKGDGEAYDKYYANNGGGVSGGKRRSTKHSMLKPKDMVGIPWRVAFALQADGWWLRSDIIWSKPNPMPESVTDRPTKAHEYVFLLAKSARYFFDQEAVREEREPDSMRRSELYGENPSFSKWNPNRNDGGRGSSMGFNGNPAGRNIRSVWQIATTPFPEAHFATFPPKLVEPCIKAGTSEHGVCSTCGAPWVRVVEREQTGDLRWSQNGGLHRANVPGQELSQSSVFRTGSWNVAITTGWRPTCQHDADIVPATVLDPFGGAGTTALVAYKWRRRCISIELNPEYTDMARRRLAAASQQMRMF